jgi:dihydrofolate reductase
MRNIVVLSMITLDGVMQAPGGPKEDTSGGFKYGGWTAPYGDEVYGKVVQEELKPADYLLGRKTFETWAAYWPAHGEFWPGINEGTKYVFSKSMKKSDPTVSGWKNSRASLKKLSALGVRIVRSSNGSFTKEGNSESLAISNHRCSSSSVRCRRNELRNGVLISQSTNFKESVCTPARCARTETKIFGYSIFTAKTLVMQIVSATPDVSRASLPEG